MNPLEIVPQGDTALELLRLRVERAQEQKLPLLASIHPLDVTRDDSLRAFRRDCVDGQLGGRVDVMFNNAGVCLAGSTRDVFESTLAVNFFGALDVLEACLPAMRRNGGVGSRLGAGRAKAGEEEKRQGGGEEDRGTTVVWISSGDGELCCLGSRWQEVLGQATSVEVRVPYNNRRIFLVVIHN